MEWKDRDQEVWWEWFERMEKWVWPSRGSVVVSDEKIEDQKHVGHEART